MIYMWGMTGPADVYANVVLGCGLVLSVGVAPLALFKGRLSAIIGGACLLITLPMFLEMTRAIGVTAGLFSPLLIISLIMFALGLVNCIRVISKTEFSSVLDGRVKVGFSILPLALVLVYALIETYL